MMSGVDDKPLLVLNRVGEGRVALLASDHAWMWHRGYEGRRAASWSCCGGWPIG